MMQQFKLFRGFPIVIIMNYKIVTFKQFETFLSKFCQKIKFQKKFVLLILAPVQSKKCCKIRITKTVKIWIIQNL